MVVVIGYPYEFVIVTLYGYDVVNVVVVVDESVVVVLKECSASNPTRPQLPPNGFLHALLKCSEVQTSSRYFEKDGIYSRVELCRSCSCGRRILIKISKSF